MGSASDIQHEPVWLMRRTAGCRPCRLRVSPVLAMLIIVVVFVFKSISDLHRLLEKLAEKEVGFDDLDCEFKDEEWR
jgi:hypothetical protein